MIIWKVAFPAQNNMLLAIKQMRSESTMNDEHFPQIASKPLAGTCLHTWQIQESPYVVAEVCSLCMLFRYKPGSTADWEYRAPIPVVGARPSEPGV